MSDKEFKGPFVASLTFTQEAAGADVYSKLEFTPRLPKDAEAPEAYDVVSQLATIYLQMAGLVSADGELVDEKAFHELVQISASPSPGSTRH